jgi:hypothetical protein
MILSAIGIFAAVVFFFLMMVIASNSGYDRGRLDGLAEADAKGRPCRPDYAVLFQHGKTKLNLPPADWDPDETWCGQTNGMRFQKISNRPAVDATIDFLTRKEARGE